jgi:hypothetical protein
MPSVTALPRELMLKVAPGAPTLTLMPDMLKFKRTPGNNLTDFRNLNDTGCLVAKTYTRIVCRNAHFGKQRFPTFSTTRPRLKSDSISGNRASFSHSRRRVRIAPSAVTHEGLDHSRRSFLKSVGVTA